jgi:transcriptional regulator with XRE-family HTH domain
MLEPSRIRAARLALQLSQEDFALLLGRRMGRGIRPLQHHISRWETGERRPANLWGPVVWELVLAVERLQREKRAGGAG